MSELNNLKTDRSDVDSAWMIASVANAAKANANIRTTVTGALAQQLNSLSGLINRDYAQWEK